MFLINLIVNTLRKIVHVRPLFKRDFGFKSISDIHEMLGITEIDIFLSMKSSRKCHGIILEYLQNTQKKLGVVLIRTTQRF